MDRYLGNEPNIKHRTSSSKDRLTDTTTLSWNEFLSPDEMDNEVNSLSHDIDLIKPYFDVFSMNSKIHVVLPETPTEPKLSDNLVSDLPVFKNISRFPLFTTNSEFSIFGSSSYCKTCYSDTTKFTRIGIQWWKW